MKVAVIQSNYIPWKGYFDIMHDVDTFIFYDHVQFTKNDWRNRNKVKTAQGSVWLTIPTGTNLNRLICEVRLEEPRWQSKHYKTICQNYGRLGWISLSHISAWAKPAKARWICTAGPCQPYKICSTARRTVTWSSRMALSWRG